MSDEVEIQSKKLDKLSDHVDKTNETLLHTNEQVDFIFVLFIYYYFVDATVVIIIVVVLLSLCSD